MDFRMTEDSSCTAVFSRVAKYNTHTAPEHGETGTLQINDGLHYEVE